jgi:hypothetical protein
LDAKREGVMHETPIVSLRFLRIRAGTAVLSGGCSGMEWHSCGACAAFIRNGDWHSLIERIIAAFAALQYISESEQAAFRHELEAAFCRPLENEVNASRVSCPLPV